MALREVLASFGFQVDDKKLQGAGKAVDSFSNRLKEVGGLLIGGALISGIQSFAGELIGAADALIDTSAQLGVSADALQRWQLAAKLSGAEAQDLSAGIRVLQRNMVDGAAKFDALGVSVKDASGNLRPSTDVLRDVGVAIASLPSEAERTAAAMDILGKSGTKLAPIFAQGGEGVDKLLAKVDELGGGLSGEALEVLGEAGDRTDEWNFAILSLKSRLAVSLFPAINQLLAFLTKALGTLTKTTQGTNIFRAALVVLGTAGAASVIKLYARFIPLAVLLAALILIVDDLITFFEGGESAFGKLLETIFGAEDAAQIARDMREDFQDLTKTLAEIPGVGAKVEEAFSQVGESLVRFFAQDIPEAVSIFWASLNPEEKRGVIDSILQTILGPLSTLQAEFTRIADEAITSLIDGLVNGLQAGVDRVKTAAINLATGGVKEPLKDIFAAKSPSRVMFELGRDIDQGLILGLASGAPGIQAATSEAFAPAVPSARTGPSSGGARVDQRNQITVSVGMGPGQDLANAVRSGVSQALSDERRAMLAALEATV
jgi:hypothetical protein